MRLLHPKTLELAAKLDEVPKTVISHAWAEVFKYCASKQKHPKMFIKDKIHLGMYLSLVYFFGKAKGCKLDETKVEKLPKKVREGFKAINNYSIDWLCLKLRQKYFNDVYLFSDACSLYLKGINIFPAIYGDEWRKYVPVESHKEILRQVTKTLNK